MVEETSLPRRRISYTRGMIRKLLLLALLMSAICFGKVYELRTYTCAEGKLEALKARFRDHTIRIFNKHGIESIGYWVPEDPQTPEAYWFHLDEHAGDELLVLIAITRPLRDPEALETELAARGDDALASLRQNVAAYAAPGTDPVRGCFTDGSVRTYRFDHV